MLVMMVFVVLLVMQMMVVHRCMHRHEGHTPCPGFPHIVRSTHPAGNKYTHGHCTGLVRLVARQLLLLLQLVLLLLLVLVLQLLLLFLPLVQLLLLLLLLMPLMQADFCWGDFSSLGLPCALVVVMECARRGGSLPFAEEASAGADVCKEG